MQSPKKSRPQQAVLRAMVIKSKPVFAIWEVVGHGKHSKRSYKKADKTASGGHIRPIVERRYPHRGKRFHIKPEIAPC